MADKHYGDTEGTFADQSTRIAELESQLSASQAREGALREALAYEMPRGADDAACSWMNAHSSRDEGIAFCEQRDKRRAVLADTAQASKDRDARLIAEEREACCRDVCVRCHNGVPHLPNDPSWHSFDGETTVAALICDAREIRARATVRSLLSEKP